MTPLSRAFAAVSPPAEVVDAVAQRLASLPVVGGLRWLPPAQWHVTLRFCGRVPDADALLGALARACGPVAAVVGLRLVGGGGFPSARRGSAFWLGVAGGDPADGLTSLAAASEAACVAAGRLRDLRVRGDLPYVCAVTAEEIARGIRPREEAGAERLLAGLRSAPLAPTDGWVAGEWRRQHASRGRTLTQGDCLIAAAALALGGRLATGNPLDFPMPELAVEHWPAGV